MKMSDIKPGDPTSHRQALGYVIKLQRELRTRSLHEVARRARVSISDVESWERGATTPNSEQWRALCQGISRQLHAYSETWKNARAEEQREQDHITRSIAVHTNGTNGAKPGEGLTTKLGDKLAGALPPKPGALLPPIVTQQTPAPDARTVNPGQAVSYMPPAVRPAPMQLGEQRRGGQTAREQMGIPEERGPDGRRLPPPVPEGGRSRAMIAKKTAFVRELILARPGIRTNGSDSVVEAVRLKFGVGLSPEIIEAVRAELGRSRLKPEPEIVRIATREIAAAQVAADKRDAAPELYPAHDPTKPAPVITGLTIPEATAEIHEGDITAAVELIRSAIPNLQSFAINVDDNGEATIDYQVREVKITTRGGSIRMARK